MQVLAILVAGFQEGLSKMSQDFATGSPKAS